MLINLTALGIPATAQFEEGKETVILKPIIGSAITAGASGIVTCSASQGEVSKRVQNIITLKINEQSSPFFRSGFSATVYLKIELWAKSDPLSTDIQTQYKSLAVNYDPATGARYNVRSYFLLNAAEQVKITVDTITITGNTGWDPTPVLQLENEMRVLRYYSLSNDAAILTPSFNAPVDNNDATVVSWIWNAAVNNNMSQLEWAWVSGEIPSGFYANTGLLFKNNSSRVDLDAGQNNYEIPLLYGDTGKLYYRVRAALRKNDGSVITGPWSSPQVFPSSGFFTGHQDSLNWQSSTGFAENGKSKTIVQYFDGSLRARQTVTKDNSSGNTVVAETIYDLQGRPNLQILPTPTIDRVIKYHRDFNRFNIPGQLSSISITDNPARYFDLSLDISKCNAAPRLDTAFGNGRYYSSNNPWITIEEKSKYIPDAEGYAYTETRYMDDATQRVSRQGGAGEIFQINNGHDTKYFYGKPSQPELDALFGTEAGDATHYSKNMVQDANGQMSISYIDMHGRTIATALAGDSTPNLNAIYTNRNYYPSNEDVSITNRLTTPGNNIVNGNSIESVSTILVPATIVHTFTYRLDPATLSLMGCNTRQICFDCKYDLEISIRPEDCSNTRPIIKKYSNLQIAPCGSSMGFTGDGITAPAKQISFVQSLSAGSWIIRKTLTVNDSVYSLRKDSALKVFLCETEQNIYDSVYNILAADCSSPVYRTTMPCDSCYARLGSFLNYKMKYLEAVGGAIVSDADIQIQYTKDSLACTEACGALNAGLNSLQSLRNQLLNDMVPYSGQYAIKKDSIKNAVGIFDPKRAEARYNIFTNSYTTAGNVVVTKPYFYRYPKDEAGQDAHYFTEDNHIDLAIEPAGNTGNHFFLNTLSDDDYVNLFQRSWAKSLIYYHPEFSKLKFAEANLVSTYAWLDNVQACTTYAAAFAKGYLTPLTSDPFFTNNYMPGDKQAMQQYLASNLGTAGETNKFSIWQLANGNVSCALKPDYEKQNCISGAKKDGIDISLDRDAVWEQFKNIYLTYRNEMVVKYINSQPNVLSRAGMDSLTNEKKQLVFANAKDIAAQNGWNWWSLATSSNADTAALTAAASAYINQVDNTDKCVGQKPIWRARLLQCEQLQNWLNKNTSSDSAAANEIVNTILDSMVMVCHNSASAQQPYGYSTVDPAHGGVPGGFEEIITHVFKQRGIKSVADSNYFCNPYSIDFPKPFGRNPPLLVNNTNIIDSCSCKRFAAVKLEAWSAGYDTLALSGSKGMNRFLLANYKDSLTPVLWQGLKKCRTVFYKDTCYNVLPAPGAPYIKNQRAMMQLPGEGCPIPAISTVSYVNADSPVNNVRVNYTTANAYESCALIILDSMGRYTAQIAIPCGGNSVTVSLPKCKKYGFRINAVKAGCNISSPVALLPASCVSCPAAAVITGVFYLNTGSVNNVQLTYTGTSASTNYRVVITTFGTGVKFTQSIPAGSMSAVLTLPACKSYSFQIFSGFTGGCYDSSNVFALSGCSLKCTQIYIPLVLPEYAALPSFLACNYQKPCIGCNALNALLAEFKTIYPGYQVPYTDSVNITDKQVSANNLLSRFLNYRTGFSKNADEYLAAIKGCVNGSAANALCSFSRPINDISDIFQADTVPCRSAQTQAAFMAQLIYQQRKEALIANFDSLYRSKCLSAKYTEQFYVRYQPKEYHYTLYYYDQAGNLVKTMPPAAVKPDYDPGYLAGVNAARIAGTDEVNTNNNEILSTRYRYNSLNQVIAQKTPDAGVSQFWYDRLGRLVISQNAKQALSSGGSVTYSYTLYDVLGRITEVGQKPQATAMTRLISQDAAALKNWLKGGGAKEQITCTKYDEAYSPIAASNASNTGLWQRNLRNRVSYTYVKAHESTDAGYPWDAATFYSYDAHGNVDTLLQDYKIGMGNIKCGDDPAGNRFKKIVYSYDLISGKVNDVAYQPGQPDGFYHRYHYDEENRLTEVSTSQDRIYWERDAVYDYYRHGPLARMELGQNRVQGLDYAYTLQGWLKGINATAVLNTSTGTSYDIGRDGIAASLNNNSTVARDAYGFSLDYFAGDYKAINNTVTPFAGVPLSLPADSHGAGTGQQLFNGNIAAMAVNIPKLGNAMVYGYSYDQLNRLVRMDAFSGLSNTSNSFKPVRLNDYHEAISYDPNGNIKTYLRNGDSRSPGMDNLSYQYNVNTNQLNHVKDGVTTPTPSDYNDIKTQETNNYRYDKIGNLVSDNSEKINNIEWTVYGKISAITKTDGTIIKYTYDASGNRISKIVTTAAGADSTYYVRDAGGNVMSVYNKSGALDLYQTELHLYGSSRLGIYNVHTDVQNCSNATASITTFTRGNKFFELANHLGNVLVTISDKKVPVSLDGITNAYYMADVVTAKDYYPGGMQEAGRNYEPNSASYRYGFGGMEKSNEIKGEGNSYAAEFWEYDPRLARRWNIDPVTKVWESSYASFSNNSIINTDPRGNSDSAYKTPGGGTLRTEISTAETYDGSAYKVGGITVKPAKGTLRSFREYNGGEWGETSRFVATFNTKTGQFTGYVWDGNVKDTYEDFRQAKKEDLEQMAEHWNDRTYEHYSNRAGAFRSLVNMSMSLALPNPILKRVTIPINAIKGFKVEGQLEKIWSQRKLFLNWLKSRYSIGGIKLNEIQAQQVIDNARKLNISKIDLNMTGLMGKEITGNTAGIPHFKIDNVHILIESGFEKLLR